MAVHKINIRANTLEKSRDKAPFLGVYQSNGTNNEEAMLPNVAEAAGQKDIQTRAILEGVFAAISRKNRSDGPTRMHLPGGISAFVGITGSFPASDSSFNPEKNKVVQILGLSPKLRNELVNVTPKIVGEADGTRIELNRVFDLAQKIPPAVIYGQSPFRCQGINIVTTDEGARVFVRNRKGVEFEVVVDEVVSSQEFTAHTAELLEPGDYYVAVSTRGGNPDGTVRVVEKPVKYLKVEPPVEAPTLTPGSFDTELQTDVPWSCDGTHLKGCKVHLVQKDEETEEVLHDKTLVESHAGSDTHFAITVMKADIPEFDNGVVVELTFTNAAGSAHAGLMLDKGA